MKYQQLIPICFIAALAVMGCKSRKSEKASAVEVQTERTREVAAQDSLLIAIKRNACFGACPQYTATVFKNGYTLYEGERNVKKIGKWKSQLTRQQIDELTLALRENKMEEKDSAYINKYLADYPVYFLWVSDKKSRRQIEINHEAPPVEIVEFTKIFERMLDQLHWSQVSGKARRDEE